MAIMRCSISTDANNIPKDLILLDNQSTISYSVSKRGQRLVCMRQVVYKVTHSSDDGRRWSYMNFSEVRGRGTIDNTQAHYENCDET
jgi:hypothetical protein